MKRFRASSWIDALSDDSQTAFGVRFSDGSGAELRAAGERISEACP